jgi:hypothetical protein
MNQPKASPLFKAVKKGDVAKLRELLAAGEPVDAQDHERMTPLMRAAQSGQAEAFRVLAEAGANLHALAMSQTDVLETAAEGGNVEIVRFLIEQGLPLEGHWQPRSPAARREGHMTPLICAAVSGKIDAVRLLVQAGANRDAKFNGDNARKQAQSMANLCKINGDAEGQRNLLAVAALLAEAPGAGGPSAADATDDVANFAVNAKQPGYLQARQLLQDRCGESRTWKPLPDHGLAAAEVLEFTLRDCRQEKELSSLLKKVREAGCQLVLSEPWLPGEDAKLVLFPTGDKFAVVAVTGTEGANYSVQTADVIAWLRELDQENPFALRYCGHDLVGGDFLGPLKSAKKVAERIVELCPSCLDAGYETAQELATALKKGKAFLVRWD